MLENIANIDRPAAAGEDALGERISENALRFVRSFTAPIERVWAALTTPEGLAVWIGRAVQIELVAGGRFQLAFNADDRMDGTIREIVPFQRLVIDWHETSSGVSSPYGTLAGDRSVISFDLVANSAGGTLLAFVHQYIVDRETMIGFGAGWHGHLTALGASVSSAAQVDRDQIYALLEPQYRQIFS